jgi:hypothetical protein
VRRLGGGDEEGVLYHRFNSRVMHRYLCMILSQKNALVGILGSSIYLPPAVSIRVSSSFYALLYT